MTPATAEREYTTVDKATWPRGPWNDEPDKTQWVDEATGLDCLAVRGPSGSWCGYVGLSPEHPWHGLEYSDAVDGRKMPMDAGSFSAPVPDRGSPDAVDWEDEIQAHLEAHGGITFSGACREGRDESLGICHVPAPGRPENVWWFGFDCAHLGDLSPNYARDGFNDACDEYRTLDYVKRETASLAAQLEKSARR